MKDRKILVQLDEMYCLDRDGAKVKPTIETDYRGESHVFTQNGELVSATRGKLRPRAKGGETFRVGPTHSHPSSPFGNNEDHTIHLLEGGKPHSMGKSLKKLFTRRVAEEYSLGDKKNDLTYFEDK
ncbi:MAG: hypothetical protein AAB768_00280 [Patescibacteria group bacterium]